MSEKSLFSLIFPVRRIEGGFALPELMVTVAIIATLAALAVPGFSKWLPDYRLKEAARDLYSNLQRARIAAIKRNRLCTVTFGQPLGGQTYDYVVYVDDDEDLEYDAGEETLTRVLWASYKGTGLDTSQGGGDGLIFVNNDDALPSIAFRPNGLTRDNAGGAGTGTVFLKNTNNSTASVAVSPVGNITIN